MQSFNAFMFSESTYLYFRYQCCMTDNTHAVTPSSVQIGCCYQEAISSGRFSCRKLPVKSPHQTSYLSHVLITVNIKSQFDIYFTSRKTKLNKSILYLHQINTRISNIRFHWKMSGSHSQCTAGYMMGMFDRIQYNIFSISILPKP